MAKVEIQVTCCKAENAMACSVFVMQFFVFRWWTKRVSSLNLPIPLTVLPSVTCQQTIDIMDRFVFKLSTNLPINSSGNQSTF